MAKTHPHIECPDGAELGRIAEAVPADLREVYLSLHALVIETLPGIAFSVDLADREIGYGAHQYGYDGWGMAAVMPYTKWVSLALVRGATLPDPGGVLEGTGSAMRHVKVHSMDRFEQLRAELRSLIEAAAHGGTA